MHTRIKTATIAAVVLVGGALAIRSGGDEGVFEAADTSKSEVELAALRAETEQLREAVANLQQRAPIEGARNAELTTVSPELIARITAALPSRAPQQGSRGAASETSPDPEKERAEQLSYANYLDDALARSAKGDGDRESAALRAKLDDVVDDASSLLDVRCSTSLCRVETKHSDRDAYRAFQARSFRQEQQLWSGPVTFIVLEEPETPNDDLVAVMYLGRGEALPSPDDPR